MYNEELEGWAFPQYYRFIDLTTVKTSGLYCFLKIVNSLQLNYLKLSKSTKVT